MRRTLRTARRALGLVSLILVLSALFIPTDHMPWMAERDPSQEWVTIAGFNEELACILVLLGTLFLTLSFVRPMYVLAVVHTLFALAAVVGVAFLWRINSPTWSFAYLTVIAAFFGQTACGLITFLARRSRSPSRHVANVAC